MKYREEHRDLFGVNDFESGEPYCLAHCVSADFGMFGGIVIEFNRRWDMKNRLLQKYGNQKKNFMKIGPAVFPEEVENYGHVTVVYNLATKPTVDSRPTYGDLNTTLKLMKSHMLVSGHSKLAIPKIGCGIDGLDWRIVSEDIQEVFKDTDIEILVCIK